MEILTFNVKGIKAAPGMRLTNGEVYSDIEDTIYLSINDSVDNWHEITEEEYEKVMKEQMPEAEE